MAKRRQRFFRHGELHLVVLALLDRQPMHGYQLMGELERLFAPGYRPSPGSVYPAIEALAEAGLVAGAEQGGRRVYELTSAGAEALMRRQHDLATIEGRTGVRLGGAGDVDDALDRFAVRVRSVAPRLGPAVLDAALDELAQRLERLAVASGRGADPVTTRRRIS